MKKVLLHTITAETIGGTTTVIKEIKNSYLSNKFNFVNLYQTEACGYNPFRAICFINKYRKLINKENADSIYICGLLYSGFLMTLAAKLSNVKKVILSIHGTEWDKDNKQWFKKALLCGLIEPLTVLLADKVFTVCKKALTNPAIKKCWRNNVYGVIYNQIPSLNPNDYEFGIFRKEQNISKNKYLISVVGRIVEGKGHEYIIKAIKKIKNENYVFAIVGDGPYIEKYYSECGVEIENGSVKLLGIRSDVLQILRDSDVFLFATLHENHSKALLEAVCMKCTALCTNVGGNPEIIEHDVSGILIPAKDDDAIVYGLKRLENQKLRISYANKAYEICQKRFSEKNTLGVLEKLFEE